MKIIMCCYRTRLRHVDDVDDSSQHATNEIRIPQSFLQMPRWWTEGTKWLDDLPLAIRSQCEHWDLRVVGELSHGSNAIIVPVVREGAAFVLRLTPPGTAAAEQINALRFWDGRGTVQLIDADIEQGAMLLERLDMHHCLANRPVDEAVGVLGQMMRRLALPAPPDVPSTAELVRTRVAELEPDWHRLHHPFDITFITQALDTAGSLSSSPSALSVNGDLHSGQVLRGSREPWLTVDPTLLRGDIESDLARVLWTRLDDMAGAADIVEHFETAVEEAGVDRSRARDWVVFRTVDYWLWGLNYGLTEDPQRCQRLASVFMT
jgi:streptomycin 6-kinase